MGKADQPFHGDRPIETSAEDRLGYGLAARHVAEAIHSMASPDGFVIGIEGEWGSGKSSFINLVSDALCQAESAPEIIRFLPWLISSREGLLKELFTEITKAAIRVDSEVVNRGLWKVLLGKVWPQRYSARSLRKRYLKGLFSRFSSRLVNAGKLAELFGLAGAGVATEAGARSIEEWLGNASLDEEKANIQAELRKLKRKIVIFIDDLDRLEPGEVVEILRLVRAVVDFPNVVFVLCYSREIITTNLSTALHIEQGSEFLEKIIQVSFPVPQPEAFDLRRMFRHEIQLLYPDLLANEDAQTRAFRDRLAHVIDDEGGRALLTPRHVVRAINALRFYAAPVLDDIDIPDMVWLQLVRLQSPTLHQWIEGYLIGFAAKHAGAMITEESKISELTKLNSILDELGNVQSSHDARRIALTSSLPGIGFDFEKQEGYSKMVLTLYERENVSALVHERKLGSPQHFRYYFALTAPQNSISDKEFSIFLESTLNSPETAVAQFTKFATTLTGQGRVACLPLMDRLKNKGVQRIARSSLPVIVDALADSMDAAALTTGSGDWGEHWIWRDGESLLEAIWPALEEDERALLAQRIFNSGKSIGWLTEILRGEIFAHGIYGASQKPESEWLLSRHELDIAAAELLRRYRDMTPADLDRVPRIAPMLYAWMQYEEGSSDEIRAKVEELCRSDEDFLKFLQKMRSWQSTNGIVFYPLKESNLSRFVDVQQARDRLIGLSEAPAPAIAREAGELMEAFVAKEEEED